MNLYTNSTPTAQEYNLLRELIGWKAVSDELANVSLDKSIYSVTLRNESQIIGMARIISDGALFYYVQDVIVHPEFQGNGYGHKLMECIEQYLDENAQEGSTIGLFSVTGKESFYSRYAYLERDGEKFGYGMCKFI